MRTTTTSRRARAAALVVLCLSCGAQAQPTGPEATAALERRIAALEVETAATEAIRAVKRLQHASAHYAEAGLWEDLADLFAENAVARLPSGTLTGKAAIRAHLLDDVGRGRLGLEPGRLNTELVLSPVVTLDPGRVRARGRWHRLAMTGQHGEHAEWSGGIFENEYVLEGGVWKIAVLDYHPQYAGSYETGWRNVKEETDADVAPVPFHYDVERAGVPIPPLGGGTTGDGVQAAGTVAASTGGAAANDLERLARRFAAVERRIDDLDAAAHVQNLQHAYGYYVDRKMWDDVADLFADDATLEIGLRGVYVGKASVRRALEQLGPAGLAHGELNDHLQLQTVVTIAPDGRTARARGTELTMTGQHGVGGELGVNVYENTYVEDGGTWKIAAMRVFPRMRTDYAKGWAESALPPVGPSEAFPPDRPPTARVAAYPEAYIPSFHFAHPVTGGAPRYREGTAAEPPLAAADPVLPAPPRSLDELAARLDDAERRLAVARAYDGAENVSNAYGYYIDEFLWHDMADIFAVDGWKELSYVGTYVGRERIRESVIRRYRTIGRRANSLVIHQKTQPVVHVEPDGQSARIRTRLFQMNSSFAGEGSWLAGIYENRVVLENGVWKIAEMDLDYTWTAGYSVGWAGVEAGAQQRFAPTGGGLADEYPPDRPLVGVTFPPYPEVAETRFHYRHPVTGR